MSARLPKTDSALQHCIADKTSTGSLFSVHGAVHIMIFSVHQAVHNKGVARSKKARSVFIRGLPC